MARQKGANNFAGTLEVLAGGPLDAREVVPTKADLLVSSNFPYPYVGMRVSVQNEGKVYILTATDVTNENNWKALGEDSGTSDYTDLTNKPQINGHTLSGNQSAADLEIKENVQADWNESDTEDPAYINNKPTIPAAQVNADWDAQSGAAEILNKPTIPAAQIQSDWNQSNTSAKDYIKNKPTIPEAIQVAEMPTAAAGYAGKLYQFIGTTGGGYTHGYFYECTEEGGVYSWTQTNTQPAGGGSAVQSDWDESDPNADDYIKNKPTLGDVAAEDKMAAADMSEIVTPLPGVMSRRMKYSTSEQIVGEWIDGKPLYQKTVDYGSLPNATSKSVSHGISNISKVVDVTGFAEGNGTFVPIPLVYSNGDAGYNVYVSADTSNIVCECSNNRSSFYAYITIRYTKTTDTANS